MGRLNTWAGLDHERHLSLIDGALDDNDTDHLQIRNAVAVATAELRAEMKEGFTRCEKDSEALRRLLTGLLVAVVTTSITIVATVLIAGGGG